MQDKQEGLVPLHLSFRFRHCSHAIWRFLNGSLFPGGVVSALDEALLCVYTESGLSRLDAHDRVLLRVVGMGGLEIMFGNTIAFQR